MPPLESTATGWVLPAPRSGAHCNMRSASATWLSTVPSFRPLFGDRPFGSLQGVRWHGPPPGLVADARSAARAEGNGQQLFPALPPRMGTSSWRVPIQRNSGGNVRQHTSSRAVRRSSGAAGYRWLGRISVQIAALQDISAGASLRMLGCGLPYDRRAPCRGTAILHLNPD